MAKKILLADDSITIQKVIGLTFANEDVQLTVVDNGDEAVMKAKELTPDLIIADVVMPGKDGYEVAYTVKHDPALQHIPVLLLTGTFETFDEAMATKVGADGYITKPFESQALIDKVNELIGNAGKPKAGPSMADLNTPMPAAAEPVDEFADLDPVEEVQPIEDLAPVETIEPVADIGMEAVEPLEAVEDPMAGFGHLQPDASESSFADVSLDEGAPAAASIDEFTDHDLPAEPEEYVHLEPAAPVASVTAPAPAAGDEGGWNMGDFNDYQAQSVASAPAAPAAPVTPVEMVDDFEPVDTHEPMAMPEPIDMSAPTEMAEPNVEDALFGGGPVGLSPEPETAPVLETLAESAQSQAPMALDQVADMYPLDETPAPAPVADLASDESTVGFALDSASEAPDAAIAAATLDGAMRASEPEMQSEEVFAQNSAAEPPLVDHSVAAQAVAMPPRFDDFAEPAPVPAAQAEVFALDSAAEPPTPAVAAAIAAAAPPPAPMAPPAFVAAPAAAPVLTAAVAAAVDTSGLESRIGEMLEAQIGDAIRKVAPEIIEQLVKKALADATERILNETIGRLRNP